MRIRHPDKGSFLQNMHRLLQNLHCKITHLHIKIINAAICFNGRVFTEEKHCISVNTLCAKSNALMQSCTYRGILPLSSHTGYKRKLSF